MAKLPPPIIKGVLPAFYEKDGMVYITIPFAMNRAVGPSDVGGFSLKIKTAQSTTYLADIQTSEKNFPSGFNEKQLDKVTFIISKPDASDPNAEEALYNKLRMGQFYKIQLAYLDRAKKDPVSGDYTEDPQEIGYYSTVGIAKYTTKPSLSIEGLETTRINKHLYHYTGTYLQKDIETKDSQGNNIVIKKDKTEKVYSYYFNIYDDKDNLIETTGELLHNSSNDSENDKSQDIFILSKDLQIDKFCYIEYGVTTINGIQAVSPRYKIIQKLSVDPEENVGLKVVGNNEEGYIDVYLIPSLRIPASSVDPQLNFITTGNFVLSRACSDTDFTNWEEVSKFELFSQYPSKKIWRDFSVEQGKEYQYSIQQYNDKNLYSNRIKSNKIKIDFEHIFLTDGKKQLKIKFNPKINNIKTNIPETKVDTIGSKYPFIFRNSQVCYKEFSISGLISYFMDEAGLFYSNVKSIEQTRTEISSLENDLKINRTTNLIEQNIQSEREFKLKVLEWLTNGEPKIFRSPVEGNYIVRLTNCSLSPLEQLGRMLHTFSCTAYEIAEFNHENLKKYNFIDLSEVKKPILMMKTVNFSELSNNFTGSLIQEDAYYIRIEGVKPGTQFAFTFENGVVENITIGVTGAYFLNIDKAVTGIEFLGEISKIGVLTYGYYFIKETSFNTYQNAYIEDVLSHQFIGKYNLIEELENVKTSNGLIKNPKVKLLQLYSLKATPREIISLEDSSEDIGEIISYPNEYLIYKLNNILWEYKNGEWKQIQLEPNETPYIKIGEASEVIIEVPYSVNNFNSRQNIRTSNLVAIEVSYQIQYIDYIVEFDENNETLYNAREVYEEKKKIYEEKKALSYPADKREPNETFLEWYDWKVEEQQKAKNDMDKKYIDYIIALDAVMPGGTNNV